MTPEATPAGSFQGVLIATTSTGARYYYSPSLGQWEPLPASFFVATVSGVFYPSDLQHARDLAAINAHEGGLTAFGELPTLTLIRLS
jgi:hypothetical protein